MCSVVYHGDLANIIMCIFTNCIVKNYTVYDVVFIDHRSYSNILGQC